MYFPKERKHVRMITMKEYRIPVELLDCKVNETELKADEDFIKGNKQNIIEELSKIGIISEIQSYFVGPMVITYNVINSNCLSLKKKLKILSRSFP